MNAVQKIGISVFSFACFANITPAFALDEIYSPNTEYRELAIEYNVSRTFDDDSSKNNEQEHELAIEAGVLPWLTLEVSGSAASEPGKTVQFDAAEIEGRIQFSEPGQNWLDSGLLLAYGHAAHKGDADSVEAKLLLQKDIGATTSTANIGFEQEVGDNGSGGPGFAFLWNTRYRYNEYFQPGFEIQSDLGQGRDLNHFSQQEHYIGPAAYGKLFGNVKYQAAYLAGLGKTPADSAARVLAEYEMHF